MSEENRPAKDRQKDAGQTDRERQESGAENKSAVDKAIDKAQEKGITEKAANMFKGKLKGR